MRSLRRLSVVSVALLPVAFLLYSAGTSAQTSAAPFTQPPPLQNPVPSVAPVLPPLSGAQSSAPQLPAPSTTLQLPPLSPNTIQGLQALHAVGAQKLSLLARNEGPCYTLRTYGFTSGPDPAEAPRLSSHTTCTPVSENHIEEVVKPPSCHWRIAPARKSESAKTLR